MVGRGRVVAGLLSGQCSNTAHMLAKLLGLVTPSARPIVVALIAICVCLLLLRPRRKPQVPDASAQQQQERRSARGPVISVSAVGVLLEFEGRSARLLPGAAEALLAVAAHADVHIVTTLPEDSDELEDSALRAMESSGLFGASVCDRRKAIFCSTDDGRGAMCRQLAPACHIDTSPKILQYLAPHVGSVVYIDAAARQLDNIRGSLSVVRSLAEYAQAYRTATAGGA